MIDDPTVDLYTKDSIVESFFDRELERFLTEKHLRHLPSKSLKSGNSHLTFRKKVTSSAISHCQKNEWEQFEIQVTPGMGADSDGLSIQIQALSGFRAPGSLANQPPPDERFRDNPLGDEALQEIQDEFSTYLQAHGVGGGDEAAQTPKVSPCAE